MEVAQPMTNLNPSPSPIPIPVPVTGGARRGSGALMPRLVSAGHPLRVLSRRLRPTAARPVAGGRG